MIGPAALLLLGRDTAGVSLADRPVHGIDALAGGGIMRKHTMNLTLTMAAIGSLSGFGVLAGCSTGGPATDEATTDDAALRAASPACSSARDACKTSLESIASGIQTACTSHDACKAAFDAAKPELEAAAKACETSIKAACVVDVGGHADGGGRGAIGGSFGGGGSGGPGHGSFGGESGHGSPSGGPGAFGGATGRGAPGGGSFDGGAGHPPDSAACQAAEMTCRESLQSLLSMPPAACTTISTACDGQTPMTPTDACKSAISDCRAALTTAAGSTHDTCCAAIVTACGGHAR